MTVIETERLILRPYVEDDAARVLDILGRIEVMKWLDDPPYELMPDLDAARFWIGRRAEREAADPFDLVRALEIRDTGVVAGTAMIVQLERREGGFVGEYEVGWHLHPDSHGQGYATEGARALLDDVFTRGLPEVWCDMKPDNAPSQRVAERLGLPYLGIMSDPWYEGEAPHYRSTREDWFVRDQN